MTPPNEPMGNRADKQDITTPTAGSSHVNALREQLIKEYTEFAKGSVSKRRIEERLTQLKKGGEI